MDYPPLLEGKFTIKGPLRCEGVGGMLLGHERDRAGVERSVAVRWFPPGTGGAEALAALRTLPVHAALPAVVGSGEELVCDWAAVDFPDGDLLASAREAGPLDPRRLLTLGLQLAGGLAALHQAGIVHGELSLDSVMLSGERATLSDVPVLLANRATDRRGEARTLAALTRTVDFLAPEQARGGAPSPAGDVYSLGALLCAAAAEQSAPASSALERLHQVLLGQARPKVPAGLPDDFAALLTEMTRVEPQSRPAAAEVEKWLATLTLEAPAQAAPAPTAPELEVAADPFEALLQSTAVSANGLAPGAEPTLQEVVPISARTTDVKRIKLPAPTEPQLPVLTGPVALKQPEVKLAVSELFGPRPKTFDLDNPPSNVKLSPLLGVPSKRASGPKPAILLPPPAAEGEVCSPPPTLEMPQVRPTAPLIGRPARAMTPASTSAFALAASKGSGLLGWLAATNGRLAASLGAAALSLLMALSMLGEYQGRLAEHETALKRPDAAAEARERQKRLEESPPPNAPSAAQLRKTTEAGDDY